ncbi:cytochrome c oxidase cbb3-type subunit 4 [Gemmobacter aquatilis]|uniref:Cytochrome c oxidase cbb3-type subunit 4 n=1 Tax=Gemmobacter aquatilis TaxID=933059 RepID=A0A1H8I7Q5_9RHOB|nr:cbb3-type cytochrome c oxidase subunit 3 [Gemmobacter aquatilis]SEN64404.1 cytochrome c oxidase cbb3-type subunit 4 [Gemmobacter aquatilis]
MDTYSFLRHFADSWMLILMTALFVGVVLYAFRPGSRKVQEEAATSIFRNEKRPAPDVAGSASRKIKEA